MGLISVDLAARHLKTDDFDSGDVETKIEQATAICLNYIERRTDDSSPAWSADTNPSTDPDFAILQAAILRMFLHLWRWRGDDDKPPTADKPFDLPEDVASLLRLLKDQTLA